MSKIPGVLGIANRAGKLRIGEEPVGSAARAKKARLILIADDAADNTRRRSRSFADIGNTVVVEIPASKAELGMELGRASCAVCAITDYGLASSFLKSLAKQYPDRYTEISGIMAVKADKAEQRRREAAKHLKNKNKGK